MRIWEEKEEIPCVVLWNNLWDIQLCDHVVATKHLVRLKIKCVGTEVIVILYGYNLKLVKMH